MPCCLHHCWCLQYPCQHWPHRWGWAAVHLSPYQCLVLQSCWCVGIRWREDKSPNTVERRQESQYSGEKTGVPIQWREDRSPNTVERRQESQYSGEKDRSPNTVERRQESQYSREKDRSPNTAERKTGVPIQWREDRSPNTQKNIFKQSTFDNN